MNQNHYIEIYMSDDHDNSVYSGNIATVPRVGESIIVTKSSPRFLVLSVTHDLWNDKVLIIVELAKT